MLAFTLLGCASTPTKTQTGINDQLILTNANIVDTSRFEVRHGALLIAAGKLQDEFDAIPEGFSGKVIDLGGR